MRTTRWLALLVGLLACGLIATGCGDDDSTTSEAASEETTAAVTATEDGGESEDGEVEDNDSIDTEAFYESCVESVPDGPGQESVETLCAAARDALEECANEAEANADAEAAEAAIAVCQDQADATAEQLESLGG